MNEITEYLDSKNIPYKLDGIEAIIKCPNCGKPKLYINVNSGLYHCFRCEAEESDNVYASGHVSTLKKEWGDILDISSVSNKLIPSVEKEPVDFTDLVDRYHFELFRNKDALKYLFMRGISEESIKRFKIGFTRRYGQNWLSIPSFDKDIPKLLKFRKLPPDENLELDKYIREKNSESILFNQDAVDKYEEIICVEGEFDAITLIQSGYENVVGMTGGCGTLLSDWYDKLILKSKVFLCLDSDDAGQGQKAAKDVWATRLGINKCYNILLSDGYDINSFFLDYTKEDFDKCFKEAKRFKVDGIISLEEVFYEMFRKSKDSDTVEKFELPWPRINKLIGGGLQRKRLMVLGGNAGIGKTSMAMQIAYHIATVYKLPIFCFCMEMPEVSLATKIVQLKYDITDAEVSFGDALIYAMDLKDVPIYFGYSSKITPQIYYNTLVEVRNRYGVQFGIFDNLQRLVRSDSESDMGKASGMFKDITMDLNIPFLLISQPRKLNSEDIPTFDVLKGSSAIPQDADIVILIHRKRSRVEDGSTSYESKTYAVVDKSRFSSGGMVVLNFKGEKSRFEEYT